ncbi:MAG: hypothetical protein QM528_09540 [Phycisphaerales bacterium]|nr:hypothetical protein [Phycisphaerales bacterium]
MKQKSIVLGSFLKRTDLKKVKGAIGSVSGNDIDVYFMAIAAYNETSCSGSDNFKKCFTDAISCLNYCATQYCCKGSCDTVSLTDPCQQ